MLDFLNPDSVQKFLDTLPIVLQYTAAVGSVVVAAKAVTVLTPTRVDDKIANGAGQVINLLLKLLNFLALNIGKDKNADDVKKD